MLVHLHIQNYALIESLNVKLSEGFVVLTGETGAGKSIILGALGLLLGERANLNSIRNTQKKCVVEGVFNISNYQLESFFQEKDIDYEPKETIIRRELLPSGKSRAFINDTPVNLTILKGLTSQLIDIHSQHQNVLVEQEAFQYKMIDGIALNASLLAEYRGALQEYVKLRKEKERLQEEQAQQNKDLDYWQFQYDELSATKLKVGELEALESENKLLNRIEDIQMTLGNADMLLSGDGDMLEKLRQLTVDMQKIADFHSVSRELGERLKSVYIEMKDIAMELSDVLDSLENDPERMLYVSERLDTIYRLQQKHGRETVEELLQLEEELEKKIDAVTNFESRLKQLEDTLLKAEQNTLEKASKLTESRREVLPKIVKYIEDGLADLEMPNAKIDIELTDAEEFRGFGKDVLDITFSANKNMPLAKISEVASGGELSRLMLTIKQMIAVSAVLPTLIFDEIDTGVSGKVADRMGKVMKSMSQNMQIISISHLPQIASKATQHLEVYKEDTETSTVTNIEEMTGEKRIGAIAKMLSGSSVSEQAIANAKALLYAKE